MKFARRPDGSWDLTREGGHSARRILHAGDITGEKCEAAMIRRVRRSGADIREQTIVVDLIMTRRLGLKGENRCVGAYVLDKPTGEIYAVRSANTILATGGCGKVYLYTCNPDSATGDGVALAWRAGAKIENMEFVQFHPTCLFHPQAKRFLISEAVRGEGAVLVDRHGREFMRKYDPRGSLAPRDIVARSIDSEMKRTGDDCVLDEPEAWDASHWQRAVVMARPDDESDGMPPADIVWSGYYYADVFWKEAAHLNRLPNRPDRIYADVPSKGLYVYSSLIEEYVRLIPLASPTVSGVSKLYSDLGDNADGSVTQQKVSEELGRKVEMDVSHLQSDEILGLFVKP